MRRGEKTLVGECWMRRSGELVLGVEAFVSLAGDRGVEKCG